MRSIIGTMGALLLAAVLGGCGGGGGGGSSGGGGNISPALTFAPGTLSTNVESGTSATVTLRATASDPSQFTGSLFVFVVDSQQVLTPSITLAPVSDTAQSVTVHTSPALAAGRYQGTLQVQLCKDSACASQIAGSPVALPYDFTVAAGPLHATVATSTAATVHRGGQLATPIAVAVSGGGASWTATTTTTWLHIDAATGKGNGSFTVNYVTPALAQGSYSGSVLVTSSDGQTATVPFTLDVLVPDFTLDSGVASFAAVNGAPIAAQTLSFEINNGVPTPWQATVSANWLWAAPLSGTTPAQVTLLPDPSAGNLASGSYSAALVLSSAGIANATVASNLTLTPAALTASTTTLTVGGPKGRDLVSGQSATVSLNTGANSWPFALSGLPNWLKSSTATGVVGGAGTSITVAPVASAITPGSASATVNMTATVNGDHPVLPITVNLNADQRRLLPSQWAVGLASSPGGTVLSRTLTVADNFGGALAWTASSDATWLTVTASGATGSNSSLTLSANPSALPANAMSYANVTITSGSAGVSPAIVRVGFWKGTAGLASIQKLPASYANIVADRIRPYVYVNNNGSSIDVYNMYTAQKVATLANVAPALGQMTVSADGSLLYALDTTSKSIAVVDLASRAKLASWPLNYAVTAATTALAIRPNGVDLLLVGDGTAYANGRSLGTNTGIYGLITATADGLHAFTQETGGAPSTTRSFDLDYSEISGGVLMVSPRSTGSTTVYDRDITVSPDGTRLYLGDAPPYECTSVDPSTMKYLGGLPGNQNLYLNNIKVASDGRVVCVGTNYMDNNNYVEVHAANGSLLNTMTFSSSSSVNGAKNSRMALSPDGFIAVVLTGDPATVFVPIGP